MGWKEKSLGELCDEGEGVIKTGPFGSQLHQSDYSEEGTPVVMPKDIIGGRVSPATVARVADEHVERLSQHQLEVGDIVYGRRGDIGRCALVTQQEQGWLCGTGCLRLKLGAAKVEPTFLFYFLNHPLTIKWIYNQAVGATMPNLNTGILRSIPISYPDKPIQRRIASILSAYDDLIENNTRRIAVLEEMARRLYEEWFVHFRFPGHEDAEFREDEDFGRIPERWERKTLYDVSEVTYGHPFKSKQFNEMGDGLGAIRIRDIKAGKIQTYTLEEGKSKHRVLNGDILVGMDGQFHMGK
jgi:type I restriction enzyme, S subunit